MMRSFFGKVVRVGVFGFAALLFSFMALPGASAFAGVVVPPGSTYYEAAPNPPKGAEVVYVGIEPIQTYGIDLSSDTFQTSFYIWLRWHGPIDPSATTDILNSTNSSANYVEQFSYTDASGQEKPTKLADGDSYQTAKISVGVSDPFSVARYPLDQQDLRIRIENNTDDISQLIYEPDYSHLSKHPNTVVAGWGVSSISMHAFLHQYGTDFGVIGQGAAASQYSQLTYDIEVSRPVSHFIGKLLLPMMVVFLATLAALFIKTDESDIVPAMIGIGLLTLIFLQQGYSSDLPPTVPVVLMDEIYGMAYLVIGVVFARSIWYMNQIHHHGNEPETYIKTNRKIAAGGLAAFAIVFVLLVFA